MLQISLQYVVTGLCYVFATKVLWVAAGTPMPLFYDAKLGVNVSRESSLEHIIEWTVHSIIIITGFYFFGHITIKDDI